MIQIEKFVIQVVRKVNVPIIVARNKFPPVGIMSARFTCYSDSYKLDKNLLCKRN